MDNLYKNINGIKIKLTSEEVGVFESKKEEYLKISFDKLKQSTLEELKNNLEKYIFSIYPEHKQRNIGIYGTEEERNNFKHFKDENILKYDEIYNYIDNECDTFEKLTSVHILFY